MQPSVYDSLSQDAFDAAESLSVMMQKEQTTYESCDYLHPSWPVDSTIITESDRLKIVDWCYTVVDQCKFDREAVAMTMELVDRFLSKPSIIAQDAMHDREQFQLVAIAALYIAIKVNEKVAFGSESFAALSQGVYSVDDIEGMELSILKGLSWRICAPTSIQMAHHILSVLLPHVNLQDSTWEFILDEVRFQTEYAVRDYYFATRRPSTVALAAIFNTLDQVDQQDRQAILHALLFVINEEFDSPRDLLAARNRLLFPLGGNDCVAEESRVLSDALREVEACSLKRGPEDSFEDQEAFIVSPRRSPHSVSCCRRENALCKN